MAITQTPAQIRKIFYDTIDKMERESNQFVNRPGKDFSRHRSFNLMAHAIENDQFFLIRVKNIDLNP